MKFNAFKEARQAAGLTIKKMSETFEIPTRTIEAWEAGDRKPPAYVERMVLKELETLKKSKKGRRKMEKEYIVNYKVESAAQWDGEEPHEEMTENSDPVEAESMEEAIDLYADYIEEQARENGYEAERFVDTNGQTVVKTEKDGEAQYYILTGAKGEPLECYGVVTMWGEDGGAWELFETEEEARAEVEKRLAASTYTQKEIDRGHPYEEIALMAWDEDEDDYIYCDSIEYFYHEACR